MADNRQIQSLIRQKKYAWAKYYEEIRGHHTTVVRTYTQIQTQITTLPTHLTNELKQMAIELKKQFECPICTEIIALGHLEITPCGHKFCKPCLDQMKEFHRSQQRITFPCPCCRHELSTS